MRKATVRRLGLAGLLGLALVLGGCGTRSMSDSGYPGRYAATGNPAYRGELSALEVLGIDPGQPATDEEIARELASHRKVAMHEGATLLLIQSGAAIRDDAAIRAASDQGQVAALKEKAYQAAADKLLARYVE